MTSRIAVDRIRCDGRGMCAELFPEGIALDDWGYAVVTAGDIPHHLLPAARLAVTSCPVMALRLARGTGATARRAPILTAVSQPQITLR
jgi:ferredoxin